MRALSSSSEATEAESKAWPSARRAAPAHLRSLACAALWLCACTGEIGEAGSLDTRLRQTDDSPGSPSAPVSSSPGTTTASCAQTPLSAAAPIARLTNTEYRNTLHTLLPKLNLPEIPLPADLVVEGFDNNARAQTPSPALIEQYSAAAEVVAQAVTSDLDQVLPCAASATADLASCTAQFVDAFVSRAYRRPLRADERARFVALAQDARATYGVDEAVGMVVQATLQSPSFLYRVELGAPARSGVAPLTGYELASRLSYFFWDDMPDDALLDAAASGALDTSAGVEAQARRLLDDPKARPAIASLFRQWLRFSKMDRMPKSANHFPDWNELVADSLRAGTEQFVDRVFWDMDGSLRVLLTDTGTFVDQYTAPLYGVLNTVNGAASALTGMTLVNTNAEQRSGILTQAGLLAAFAHETADSPVLRGVFVMDRLLCSAPPPPPPGVTGSILDTEQSAGTPLTTRDRVALTHESGDCASCHHTIDGFGFGFSHYDAVGRWRETENGVAVNATGWIDNTRDANGPFNGAVELGQRLAASTQVSECASKQWYRYSLGLGAADVDSCALAPIVTAFNQSGGSLKELTIRIATSDAFRNRPEIVP